MKKFLATTSLVSLLSIGTALADPAVMVGLSFDFGHEKAVDGLGLTVKALSSDRPDMFVGGVGATYFFFDDEKKFGLDLSAGYTFDNGAVLAGYDFLNMTPQLSAGWADTRDKKKPAPLLVSDHRLKRDVTLLTTLDSGIRIYAFRYIWSDEVHVGVMAQDLLAHREWRKAVFRQSTGFLSVRYDLLGLRMATLGEWKRDGLAAVLLDAQRDIAA